MEKKEFVKYLNDIFKAYGFVKKGNYWFCENDVLKKVINLQKSRFGNSYYLNFGYVLKNVNLQNLMMHVYNRLGSLSADENRRIKELLNFELDIEDEQRKTELEYYIKENMLETLKRTNSEQDILDDLKKRKHLNDIPVGVKRYFNLPEGE